MFDTILIITSFLLASLFDCLLTLRLSINIKHLCLFFHSLPILTDFYNLHIIGYLTFTMCYNRICFDNFNYSG